MTNTDTQNTEAVAPKSKLDLLRDAFSKSGALIFAAGSAPSELEALSAELSAVDWSAKAPETFSGLIVAKTKGENPTTRIVAFPDKATALADPIVAETLYQRFIRMVLKAARNPDSVEDQFTKPAGVLGVPFDRDAFRFQASKWVKALRELGLKAIGPRSLEMALKNTQFASSMFPAFKEWEKLIGLMSKYAEDHGQSPSIFAHWAATRSQAAFEAKPVTLGDVDALLAKIENEADEEDDDGAE